MTLQLEQYLDSLESLPVEMKRNFNLMKDLDTRTLTSLQCMDSLVNGYISSARSTTSDRRNKQLKDIEDNFVKAKELSDDKVNLAQQTYDMVDKHIRRLDNDLARFEGQLKQKIMKESQSSDSGGGGQKRKGEKGGASVAGVSSSATGDRKRKRPAVDLKEFEDEIPRISDKKRKKKLAEMKHVSTADPMSLCNLSGQALIQTLASAAGDALDMPVDPNEPTYCVCHQVSYGEMIGCDNMECPIEWFHFGCVGLSNKPKGKWYCPRCTEERKKNK